MASLFVTDIGMCYLDTQDTRDVCEGCGKPIPANEGCDDDMPFHCDACWCKAHHPAQVADATPISSDITYV